jgi:hypothetical protein
MVYYEPLYKFSRILDMYADDKEFQMHLILLRMKNVQENFGKAKTEDDRQTMYDDLSALNDIFGALFRDVYGSPMTQAMRIIQGI